MQDTSCEAGWQTYYERAFASSMADRRVAYSCILDKLPLWNPAFIPQDRPLHLVLGGFDARNSTLETFINLGQNFLDTRKLPNGLSLSAVDMNTQPIEAGQEYVVRLKDQASPVEFCQARLEELDLGRPVDVLFLDYTLHFMDTGQMRSFMDRMKNILSTQGVVISASSETPKFIQYFDRVLGGDRMGMVGHFAYSPRDIEQTVEAGGLKLVYVANRTSKQDKTAYIVFAQADSAYEEWDEEIRLIA